MAKLFIGYEYINFIFNKQQYQGVLSKIILEEKTIFRVDYTSKTDLHTGRFEISYIKYPNGESHWFESSSPDPELSRILVGEIEKNQEIFQLD